MFSVNDQHSKTKRSQMNRMCNAQSMNLTRHLQNPADDGDWLNLTQTQKLTNFMANMGVGGVAPPHYDYLRGRPNPSVNSPMMFSHLQKMAMLRELTDQGHFFRSTGGFAESEIDQNIWRHESPRQDHMFAFPTPTASQSTSRMTVASHYSHRSPREFDFADGGAQQFTFNDFERLSNAKHQQADFHHSYADIEQVMEDIRKEAVLDHRSVSATEFDQIFTADDVHNLVKNNRDPRKLRTVSNKVFVGGISHNMERSKINKFFAQFGNVFVDWPTKQAKVNARGKTIQSTSYSYLFLVYSDEESVLNLMKHCHSPPTNDFFVQIPGCQENMIQIRPWFLRNAFYVHPDAENKKVIDIHRTVFVGGLPRIVTAAEIAKMLSEFGKVLLVTIDIDQDYGYPKGAARVAFATNSAFNSALEKRYLKFANIDSSKTTIEIKPYVIEDVGCDQCGGLWFNPFLDIMEYLEEAYKEAKIAKNPFNIWSNESLFHNSHQQRLKDIESSSFFELPNMTQENEAIVAGANLFYSVAKKFDLTEKKTFNFNGKLIPIGPTLWNMFLPVPKMEAPSSEMLSLDSQVQAHLKMKRHGVYSNKSLYCKDKPCRQYYCSSCSHKLHYQRSSSEIHQLLPVKKPERRPRKDKNMYLVRQQ
ncbi:unnamed protein product [Caenorhabditis bovis]|uniref:RRM domain-containing protein n=1 Tax=Caenorhabditis bovis TaxID=2654633 RepID=A0A8S1EUC1_9PELO|nr:unnamed protein product [Caenorhabditis bovis]